MLFNRIVLKTTLVLWMWLQLKLSFDKSHEGEPPHGWNVIIHLLQPIQKYFFADFSQPLTLTMACQKKNVKKQQ